jgi:hypothetical protein
MNGPFVCFFSKVYVWYLLMYKSGAIWSLKFISSTRDVGFLALMKTLVRTERNVFCGVKLLISKYHHVCKLESMNTCIKPNEWQIAKFKNKLLSLVVVSCINFISILMFLGLITDILVQLCQKWRLMISMWKMNPFYVSINIYIVYRICHMGYIALCIFTTCVK